MKQIVLLLMIFNSITLFSQKSNRRTLDELVISDSTTWTTVRSWLDSASNTVEVIKNKPEVGDSAILKAQVTTNSTMGVIIHKTGGVLIDNGWIRIIGSGSPQLTRSLMGWNQGKSFTKLGQTPSFLLIADDVLGGFFAVNGGGIDTVNIGKVFYFAPDALQWENIGLGYTDFIYFCCFGDIELFYKGMKWDTWKKDIISLPLDSAYSFYPFLWTKEGQDINKVTRKATPIEEVWDFYFREK